MIHNNTGYDIFADVARLGKSHYKFCLVNDKRILIYRQCTTKENRIYIRGEFTRKNVKRAFCCTVSILQVYFTYLCNITFWALEYHFIENLKLMLKENQIMK